MRKSTINGHFNSYVSLPEVDATVVTLPAAQKEHHMSVSTEMKDLPVNGSRFLTYTQEMNNIIQHLQNFRSKNGRILTVDPICQKAPLNPMDYDLILETMEAIFLKGHFRQTHISSCWLCIPLYPPKKPCIPIRFPFWLDHIPCLSIFAVKSLVWFNQKISIRIMLHPGCQPITIT